MSIEQSVREALEAEADALTPVADVEALLTRGEHVRRRRLVAVGTVMTAVAVLLAATSWMGVNRAAEPVAPADRAPRIPLLRTVPVGDSPEEVVVDPTHGSVYVSERSMAKVSVIDTATMAVVDAIDVGIQPRGLAIDPEAGYVYVANAGVASVGSVSVIRTGDRRVVHTIPLGEGTLPLDVAADTGSHTLFVAENGASAVGVVDTRTWRVVDTIPVGDRPIYIAVDPVVGEVYVTTGETLIVIDARSRKVVDTIDGLHAGMVATDPASGLLLVASRGSGTVSIVKTRTHELAGTVPVGGSGPLGLQVDDDSATAYVTGAGQRGGMAVLDLDRLRVIGRVAPALDSVWCGQPAVDPDTRTVYAPLGGFTVGVIPRQ